MPKLVYIYGDDNQLLDTMIAALRNSGYSVEYTTISSKNECSHISADIALICKPVSVSKKIKIGRLFFDMDNLSATFDGTYIHFTPIEFSLLSYLLENVSRAVSRAELLPAVWGRSDNSGTRAADDTVKRLRKKLFGTGVAIDTVWGYGFKIREA